MKLVLQVEASSSTCGKMGIMTHQLILYYFNYGTKSFSILIHCFPSLLRVFPKQNLI